MIAPTGDWIYPAMISDSSPPVLISPPYEPLRPPHGRLDIVLAGIARLDGSGPFRAGWMARATCIALGHIVVAAEEQRESAVG